MTDEEIIERIATGVMGWERITWKGQDPDIPCWGYLDRDEILVYKHTFDPLLDDNDCMAAWDKFSEDAELVLSFNGKRWSGEAFHGDGYVLGGADHEDRRRAMCEVMVMATAKENER